MRGRGLQKKNRRRRKLQKLSKFECVTEQMELEDTVISQKERKHQELRQRKEIKLENRKFLAAQRRHKLEMTVRPAEWVKPVVPIDTTSEETKSIWNIFKFW